MEIHLQGSGWHRKGPPPSNSKPKATRSPEPPAGRNNTDTAIEDGKFKDGTLTFTVTREFNGNKFTPKYSGKLDGDTIKGSSERPGQDGGDPVKRALGSQRR